MEAGGTDALKIDSVVVMVPVGDGVKAWFEVERDTGWNGWIGTTTDSKFIFTQTKNIVWRPSEHPNELN